MIPVVIAGFVIGAVTAVVVIWFSQRETLCATCGGTREVADYYSRRGADNGFSAPCPDCGEVDE